MMTCSRTVPTKTDDVLDLEEFENPLEFQCQTSSKKVPSVILNPGYLTLRASDVSFAALLISAKVLCP